MQIFQRGVNESVVIGRDVVVTVLDIQPHCVRIAVRNPEASPAYIEQTLFFDPRDDGESSSNSDTYAHEESLYCFDEELELSGSHLGSW